MIPEPAHAVIADTTVLKSTGLTGRKSPCQVFAEPTCLRANAPLVQLLYKWDERDPLDSWEQPMKTRHYHGVRKYLSEGAVS